MGELIYISTMDFTFRYCEVVYPDIDVLCCSVSRNLMFVGFFLYGDPRSLIAVRKRRILQYDQIYLDNGLN